MAGPNPSDSTASTHPTRQRVTLADVASRVGVSRSAASFALTGRTDQRISEETKRRVLEAARELGYRASVIPKILRSGNSGTIALVSEYMASTPYGTGAIAGALDAARQHGTLMFIAETLGDEALENRLLLDMLDRQVDGFVYAAMFTRKVSIPEPLRRVPLVLLNCVTDDVDVPMVVPDEVAAGATTVRALVKAGHREGVFYLGAPTRGFKGAPNWDGRLGTAIADRLRGVRAECRRQGITLAGVEALVDWEPADGRAAVDRLLGRGVIPSALICANDRIALGAYQALSAAGLLVPENVSVVSFDDSEVAGWVQPALSSIALPYAEMGRNAVELLMSDTARIGRHLVRMPLHDRDSIASPHAG